MVVNMIKWRPWPPLSCKKFEAKIIINKLKGLEILPEKSMILEGYSRLAVEIKWKGSKGNALSYLRRTIKRNFTKEESLREDGVVEWNEEFQSVCNFSGYKDCVFYPWEVVFTVFNGSKGGESDKVLSVATGSLNLADFSTTAGEKDIEISIPMRITNSNFENDTLLCLSLRLLEMRTAQESSEIIPRSIACLPLSPRGEVTAAEKDEIFTLKTGSRKVNFFRGLSTRKAKKESREDEGSDGKSSVRSGDAAECIYPLDTDSLDESDEKGEAMEEKDSHITKSFSYGTLAYANYVGQLYYSSSSSSEDEDLLYYSSHNINAGNLSHDDSITTVSKSSQSYRNTSMQRILTWRRRKMSFKSSKAKGEPLLKKHYGDEGGDDIDYDRRQLSSSDESSFWLLKTEEDAGTNRSSFSEFGDDSFAVGSWEEREILSRDGHMKLQTKVFFASIDQRNERAAGEGACTALVAVIADWFQGNCDQMPIKCQLDSLIREGSLKWRNLCQNETYRERFPDKHFDLETVLQAKICSLSVVPEKSFIGFFCPEGIEDGGFDFLQGAMSFDNIWNEISKSGPDCSTDPDPLVYIVSWNDHFFILKVEQEAYYIIDTLGERLFEGCSQAFILKFDRDTTIHQVSSESQQSDKKSTGDRVEQTGLKEAAVEGEIVVKKEEASDLVCKGKDSCKEYIKTFLAAIPIRELQVDIKKGLMASTPLHHRLQIEFHYTKHSNPVPDSDCMQAVACTAEVLPFAVECCS